MMVCARLSCTHTDRAKAQTAHDAHYFLGVHSDWLTGSVAYTSSLTSQFPGMHLTWAKPGQGELLKVFSLYTNGIKAH